MKKLFSILLLSPLFLSAQTDTNKGIKWTAGISWEQIKQKAKTENKYIFVDCFATWCGPCKHMDKNIYPLEKVGDYFNLNFVSVRMQMDTTKKDNEAIKQQYPLAHMINESYKVNVYPTFLFLSPDGVLVHKTAGGYDEKKFLALASDALNPDKQYYKLLVSFKSGLRDTAAMKVLIRNAQLLGDSTIVKDVSKEFANTIRSIDPNTNDLNAIRLIKYYAKDKVFAKQLAENYINKLTAEQLLSKENIAFLREFTLSSKDKGFKIFYDHSKTINHIMKDSDFVQFAVSNIIQREEIVDPIISGLMKSGIGSPDWEQMYAKIKAKYNQYYAYRTVIGSKVDWYGYKEDWPEYTKNMILLVRNHGKYLGNFILNNVAWNVIFMHSEKKSEIDYAISWMKDIVAVDSLDAEEFDTYANLLYKGGRIKEALRNQKRAVELDPSNQEIIERFEKMKKGEPTWPKKKVS